ncbi:phosphoenolpyruvate synthase [Patescibacteria group bacterium]
MTNSKTTKNILWFREIDKDDLPFVGGKGANLGEMTQAGLPVPDGFVVTVKAYFEFLKHNRLQPKIKEILKEVKSNDPVSYQKVSRKIRKLVNSGEIPSPIALEIMKTYLRLGKNLKNVLVAVRSSATAEDLPTASFAGQQATYLNIKGEANVINAVRLCWASLFTARAIFYREENDFDHFKVGIAVPVQEMIQSEVSGVMFTTDPITGEKNRILIEAIYGLGELIVRGELIPDRYLVDRQKMKIINKSLAKQTIRLVKVGRENKKAKVPHRLQDKQKMSEKKIIELAVLGKKIHQHYFFPQDVEWGMRKNKLYILQTRPITTLKQKKQRKVRIDLPLILTGESASPGIATGKVRIVSSARRIGHVKKGEILVTSMTTPDFVPAMKKVVGIITDLGGQTSHAAIVSRELGVSCIIGTKTATKKLKNGEVITINGKTGQVFRGGLKWKGKVLKGRRLPSALEEEGHLIKTATRLYVNLAEPEKAAEIADKNVDGVGLLRAEFMLAQYGIHPRKVIADKKQAEFIKFLTTNLETFCKSFHPRPVVYRATDFKTNEYRNLKGGARFEPEEENPLIGFRGAYRYIADPEVFQLELQAIRNVRNKLGFKNLWLMIPFVRTPKELLEVKKIIVSSGLIRSPSFKLWLMVEIPANVILLEQFAKVGIDGVSIGSNDLTMLILGVDRDNAELSEVFDERNPAVLWALKKTIQDCHRLKLTSSICGQAPTMYASLVADLIKWGVSSVSIAPDKIEATRKLIYSVEAEAIKERNSS